MSDLHSRLVPRLGPRPCLASRLARSIDLHSPRTSPRANVVRSVVFVARSGAYIKKQVSGTDGSVPIGAGVNFYVILCAHL